MKAASPIWVSSPKMFLVVSRLDEHFGFDHPLFACPIEKSGA